MDVFEKKLELMESIKKKTEAMLEISIDNQIEKYEDILLERQTLMDEVDKINLQISVSDKKEDEKTKKIIQKTNKIIQEIIELDEKIRQQTYKAMKDIKEKIEEADKRTETSDYDFSEVEKRPVGYFLNRKG